MALGCILNLLSYMLTLHKKKKLFKSCLLLLTVYAYAPKVIITGRLHPAAGLPPQYIIDKIVPADFVDTDWNQHKLYSWIIKIGKNNPNGSMSMAKLIADRPAFTR